MVDPPALPARFNRMTAVLAVGSVLWAVAAVVVAVTRPLDLVFLTCVVGAGLGGVGYTIFAWQRAAARRGSRGAQRGLD